MAKLKSAKIKKIGATAIFIIGLMFVFYSVYQTPLIKNKIPWLDYQIRAIKYQSLAKQIPTNDYRAKRYRAMAEALKKGQKDYQFETGPLPPMGNK